MKSSNMKYKSQVYSVGNYLMTGKVLGKGHFARVEEATHRVIGKKVAIKIIDLTCIKEEYARRNLHREPKVMAKLRHPCIAALYETMMHGPRLYVVMEAAGGGDLCAHVLAARGPSRGLPEPRARHLAAQLVSAVKHMHSRGVVHRDLKMENIMLDSTKHYIKIVDFGLSNTWTSGGALRTPCGSLEYAAPELFVDGRRYGPEVDLWSVGVIVYGMVTGGLPFTGAESGEGRSRPQLRAAIARGFTRKQRAALACVSNECKAFVQQLLEPNVNSRMKIEEASRHRWIRKQGLRMRSHPLQSLESKSNNEICKQIAELCGESLIEVVARIKADPFGALGGMYNIRTHLHQLQSIVGTDPLWSANVQEPRPVSPPEYRAKYELDRFGTPPCTSKCSPSIQISPSVNGINKTIPAKYSSPPIFNVTPKPQLPNGPKLNGGLRNSAFNILKTMTPQPTTQVIAKAQAPIHVTRTPMPPTKAKDIKPVHDQTSPRSALIKRSYLKKPMYKVYDNGDCGPDPRLPCINEHSNTDFNDSKNSKHRSIRTSTREVNMDDERTLRLNSCPNKMGDGKPSEFYRRAGDGFPCWRNGIVNPNPPRILFQNNATTIKRASLGNIVSPHSSSNSQCKSERAMPIGWYVNRNKDTPLQRFRRTTPMK